MQKTSGLQTNSDRKRASAQHAVTHKDSNGATIQQNQANKKVANRTGSNGRVENHQEAAVANVNPGKQTKK